MLSGVTAMGLGLFWSSCGCKTRTIRRILQKRQSAARRRSPLGVSQWKVDAAIQIPFRPFTGDTNLAFRSALCGFQVTADVG